MSNRKPRAGEQLGREAGNRRPRAGEQPGREAFSTMIQKIGRPWTDRWILAAGFWNWVWIGITWSMVAGVAVAVDSVAVNGNSRSEEWLQEPCKTPQVRPMIIPLRNIPEADYGRPGLSHMTIAGAMHHGMKEIEVWMQTFAPGSGTPIHRHECEEVFVVMKGSGTLRLAQSPGDGETPGDVQAYTFHENDTFVVPVDAVHQVTNTDNQEDLQLLVIISRPPIKIFAYPSWDSPHAKSQMIYPYTWDRYCPSVQASKGDEKWVQRGDPGLDEADL